MRNSLICLNVRDIITATTLTQWPHPFPWWLVRMLRMTTFSGNKAIRIDCLTILSSIGNVRLCQHVVVENKKALEIRPAWGAYIPVFRRFWFLFQFCVHSGMSARRCWKQESPGDKTGMGYAYKSKKENHRWWWSSFDFASLRLQYRFTVNKWCS